MVNIKIYFAVIYILIILQSCGIYYVWDTPTDIDTLREYQIFVSASNKLEIDHNDNWKTPWDTYYSKSGDCEDWSGLLSYCMIYKYGFDDVKLVACISKTSRKGHMAVYADGKYYQGVTGYVDPLFTDFWEIIYYMRYETYEFIAKIK